MAVEEPRMFDYFKKHRRWKTAILSLSLLTVMAGAAVAPALDLIRDYFSDVDPLYVQLIISMPALFIAITNLFFQRLSRRFRARTLLIIGLGFYVVGGCAAGLFSNIFLVLVCRAVVGVGVGIIMPLSTGLIAFYFTRDKQDVLMGYSSAMNMLGGVVATLIAGALSMFSWRLSFFVYLLGLISIILCALWMPNESIYDSKQPKKEQGVFRRYYVYIVAMFLLMATFFIYPADFAMETAKQGIIPVQYVAIIMASMDILGFFGGLAYAGARRRFGAAACFIAPVLFACGYGLLSLVPGWFGTLAGSFIIGFANGIGVPFIMTTAAAKAGAAAPTTVMPMLSLALYLAQFVTPFLLTAIRPLLSGFIPGYSSYTAAIFMAALFFLWSILVFGASRDRSSKSEAPVKKAVREEAKEKMSA